MAVVAVGRVWEVNVAVLRAVVRAVAAVAWASAWKEAAWWAALVMAVV